MKKTHKQTIVVLMVLVIIGAMLDLRSFLLVPAILGSLATWDSARFQQRMGDTPISDSIREIEKRHLGLLTLTLFSGGIIAGVVLTARMHISFGIALVFGVILIISFGQIYRMLMN